MWLVWEQYALEPYHIHIFDAIALEVTGSYAEVVVQFGWIFFILGHIAEGTLMNRPPLESDQALIDTENVFDDLLAGKLPASFVYQDELVAAFMDIQPVNPGHVLIVPRQCVRFLCELDDETANRLFLVGRRVAQSIRDSGLPCEGVNMFVADGSAAGQEVPHVHLHVFPRYIGDGFGFNFAERYFELPSRKELDEAADKLRIALERAK